MIVMGWPLVKKFIMTIFCNLYLDGLTFCTERKAGAKVFFANQPDYLDGPASCKEEGPAPQYFWANPLQRGTDPVFANDLNNPDCLAFCTISVCYHHSYLSWKKWPYWKWLRLLPQQDIHFRSLQFIFWKSTRRLWTPCNHTEISRLTKKGAPFCRSELRNQ